MDRNALKKEILAFIIFFKSQEGAFGLNDDFLSTFDSVSTVKS